MKKLLFILSLLIIYVFAYAGVPHSVNALVFTQEYDGGPLSEPASIDDFEAWISSRPAEVRHLSDFGNWYFQGWGLSNEAGNFTTSWAVGDEHNITAYLTDYLPATSTVILTSNAQDTGADIILIKEEDISSDFSADQTQVDPDTQIQFTDLSTGNITTWEWDFDNDSVIDSDEQNPTWIYTVSGIYTVSLTVSDGLRTGKNLQGLPNLEGLERHSSTSNKNLEGLNSTRTSNTETKTDYIYVREVALQDSLALVALYNSTNGNGWEDNTNWLSNEPIDDWYGVTVQNGRVTQLNLYQNTLTGTIPAGIGDLTALTSLNFGSGSSTYPDTNHLTGSIPAEIGNLINMTSLNLYYNDLSGIIPSEISNLTNLTTLDLSSNDLNGEISDIVSYLNSLPSLSYLNIGGNEISGIIPTEIGNLTNLTTLYLYSNQLSGIIPTEIGNLTNLTTLSLYSNELTGEIPTEIGNLTNLTYLYLYSNQLTGEIPTEITNCIQIEWLLINDNNFTDLPELTAIDSLRYLRVYDNQFTFEDIEPNLNAA